MLVKALVSLFLPPVIMTSLPFLPSTVTVQCSDTAAGISSFSSFFQPFSGLFGSKASIVFSGFFSLIPPVARRYLPSFVMVAPFLSETRVYRCTLSTKSLPERCKSCSSVTPIIILYVEAGTFSRFVNVSVRRQNGPPIAAGCDPPVSVGGAHLPAPHHGGGDRGDGQRLGSVAQPRLYHVHQVDGTVGVVASQGAEEEYECVAPCGWVDRGRAAGSESGFHIHFCINRGNIDRITRAVFQEALINIYVNFLHFFFRFINCVFICR